MGFFYCTTRTSGGDPDAFSVVDEAQDVLPARAGVIP